MAAAPGQQQQQEAQLAQAWLQAVSADPTALASMRAAVGARAAQATAEGSDPQAAQQHLVTALVRAIVETQARAPRCCMPEHGGWPAEHGGSAHDGVSGPVPLALSCFLLLP